MTKRVSSIEYKKDLDIFSKKHDEYLEKYFEIYSNENLSDCDQTEMERKLNDDYKGYTDLLDFDEECIIDETYFIAFPDTLAEHKQWFRKLFPYYNHQIADDMVFLGLVENAYMWFYLVKEHKCIVYYSYTNDEFVKYLKDAFKLK